MKSLQNLLESAVTSHQQGDFKTASALYHEVLRLSPQHPEALHLLGVIALQQKRYDSAVKLIEQAINGHAQAAPYHYNLAECFFAKRHYQKAYKALLKSVNLQPLNPQAWSRIGLLQHRAGNLQNAHSSYQQSIRQQPDAPATLNNLGLLLFDLNELTNAEKQFRKALHLQPDYVEACHNLAIVLTQQKRVDEGAEYFKKALTIAPNLPGLRCNYIRLLQNICAWPQLQAALQDLHQLTDSELQQNRKPEESPFLNLSLIDNPEQNLKIAEKWSTKINYEIKLESENYAEQY